MNSDYYPDSGEGDSRPAMAEKPNDKPSESSENETALIPKSLLAGKEFKPGEEVVLKIVRMYEDEVEVEYAKEEPDKPGMSEGLKSSNDEIDMMAKE